MKRKRASPGTARQRVSIMGQVLIAVLVCSGFGGTQSTREHPEWVLGVSVLTEKFVKPDRSMAWTRIALLHADATLLIALETLQSTNTRVWLATAHFPCIFCCLPSIWLVCCCSAPAAYACCLLVQCLAYKCTALATHVPSHCSQSPPLVCGTMTHKRTACSRAAAWHLCTMRKLR